jgi:hypothetical protein
MSKNADLKVSYLSQENDREMLIRQLITEKKESFKMKKRLAFIKKEGEEAKLAMDESQRIQNEFEQSASNSYGAG